MDIRELEKLFRSSATDDDCLEALLTFIVDNEDNSDAWGEALTLAGVHRKEPFEGEWLQRLLRGMRTVMPESYTQMVPPNMKPDYH